MWEELLQQTADEWIRYLCTEYEIPAEDIKAVIVTEETNTNKIVEIQFFIQNCPYIQRKHILSDLEEKMDPITVSVFGE